MYATSLYLFTREHAATHHPADKLYVKSQNCQCAQDVQYLHNNISGGLNSINYNQSLKNARNYVSYQYMLNSIATGY